MNTTVVFGITSAIIFALALYSVITARHVVRTIIAFNVMGTSVFLLLVTMAHRGQNPDPVPHAMVLTGIVVTIAMTGLAVALVRRRFADEGETSLPGDGCSDGDR